MPTTSGIGPFSRLLPALTAYIAVNVESDGEISAAPDVVGDAVAHRLGLDPV